MKDLMEDFGSQQFTQSSRNSSLVDTFNQSAADYAANRLPPALLVHKFQALSTYKTDDEKVRADLAEALFTAAEKSLRQVSAPNGRLQTIEYISSVRPLLDALTRPENVAYVPQRAAGVLADIAIALADRAGKVTEKDLREANLYSDHIGLYRNHVSDLAGMALEFAARFSELQEQKPKAAKLVAPKFTQ